MTHTNPAVPVRGRRGNLRHLGTLFVRASLLGVVAACDGGSSTAPAYNGDPIGVYRLTQIDNRALPVTIYNGPYTDPQSGQRVKSLVATVVDGVVGLAEDGTYQLAVDILINADGDVIPVPLTGFGSYEVQGNKVAFTSDAGATGLKGTLGNTSIALPYPIRGETRQLVFRKAQ
jgi:hypothetical protein